MVKINSNDHGLLKRLENAVYGRINTSVTSCRETEWFFHPRRSFASPALDREIGYADAADVLGTAMRTSTQTSRLLTSYLVDHKKTDSGDITKTIQIGPTTP
jgi:hypothetical protein